MFGRATIRLGIGPYSSFNMEPRLKNRFCECHTANGSVVKTAALRTETQECIRQRLNRR